MSERLLLRSTRVYIDKVLRPAIVEVVDGRIAGIHPHDAPLPAEDLGSLVISPGFIDAHVHLNEPGRTEWEGVETGTGAAVAGGITLIGEMPLNSSPVTTTVAALDQKIACIDGKLYCDIAPYAGVVAGSTTADIEALARRGVRAFKAFMIHSGIDEFPAAQEDDLRLAMETLGPYGVPLLLHAELPPQSDPPAMTDPRSYKQYAATRPAEMEERAADLILDMATDTRCRAHIVHVAAAGVVEDIYSTLSSAVGAYLTLETCPHYLTFCEEEIPDGDTRYKCAPPIRDRANREKLWLYVKEGLISIIASDHSPASPDVKEFASGRLDKAWGGIASLQFLFPAAWTGARQRGIPLETILSCLTSAPAALLGVAHRLGSIKPGLEANVVVFDPDAEFTVTPDIIRHRHKATPYEGMRLYGVVHRVYLRGTRIDSLGSCRHGRVVLGSLDPGIDRLNASGEAEAAAMLETCCGATKWWKGMLARRPFVDRRHLLRAADDVAKSLQREDWLEAFAHHPRIGDIESLRKKFASTAAWAASEQSGVNAADERVLSRLAEANREHEDRFGYIFIICATGKSAAEMLEALEERLKCPPSLALAVAAHNQQMITRIRLEKLLA